MDAKFTSAELNVCYKDFEGNSVPPSTSPCMRMKVIVFDKDLDFFYY